MLKSKIQLIFLGLVILTLNSCYVDDVNEVANARASNDADIQKYISEKGLNATGTGSGLFYQITETTGGQAVVDGDSLIVHFVARLLSGTIVDSTSEIRNRPDKYLIYPNSLIGGFNEGLKLIKEGERAKLLVPSYLAYGVSIPRTTSFIPALPSNLPPFSVLIYDVYLKEVISQFEQIDNYITRNNYTITQVVSDSVTYIRTQEGSPNTKPVDNDTIRVTYTGKFLNGNIFDSSLDSSFTTPIGKNAVVRGFEAGLKLMNQGEKGIIIMHSKWAYGEKGNQGIYPFAPLVFEVGHVKKEDLQIQEYIASEGLGSPQKFTSGLYKILLQDGIGNKPDDNDSVYVNVTGKLLNNTVFIQENGKKVSLKNLDSFLKKGLKEGIMSMKLNEKSIFLIPSPLAFGTAGNGIVPKRSPVVYEIELIALKPQP